MPAEINPASIRATSFIRTLLDDADAAAARTTLGVAFVGCSAYRTTNLSIDNETFTAVTLPDGENFDTDTMHSTASNTSRITVPATGYYLITASCQFAVNGTGIRAFNFRKNGTTDVTTGMAGWTADPTIGATYGNSVNGSVVASLAASDYVELMAYQSSGGALNVAKAELSVCLLGR